MGWSGGTTIANRMIPAAVVAIPNAEARAKFYTVMIDALEDADWDTQEEALGTDPVFDEVLYKRDPWMKEDE